MVGAIAVPPACDWGCVTVSVQVAESDTILGMLSLDRLQVNRQPGMNDPLSRPRQGASERGRMLTHWRLDACLTRSTSQTILLPRPRVR